MIYGVSKTKEEGLGYSQKYGNPRNGVITEPTKPTFSSNSQKGLDSYFVAPTEKVKVLNQLKLKGLDLVVLKKSGLETSKSKVLKKSEPKTLRSKVMKRPKPKPYELKVLK